MLLSTVFTHLPCISGALLPRWQCRKVKLLPIILLQEENNHLNTTNSELIVAIDLHTTSSFTPLNSCDGKVEKLD